MGYPSKIIPKSELYDLYWNQNLSRLDIARLFDVDKSTILNWMKNLSIKRRSLIEANLLRKGKRKSRDTEFTSERLKQLWKDPVFLEKMKNRPPSMLGKKHSEETKQKISRSRQGIPAWNKGMKIPYKPRPYQKGRKPWNYGKKLTKEHREKLRKAKLGKKQPKEMIENRRRGIKKAIADGNFNPVKNFKHNRPTRPEKELINIIRELELPFTYVGDGSFWINAINPDFINHKEKKVIEVFGRIVHDPFGPFKVRKTHRGFWGRTASLQSEGYDPLILYDDEILNNREETTKKILNWENEHFKSVGDNPRIYPTAIIINPNEITLGSNIMIQDFVFLYAGNGVTLGNNSQLNAHCSISGGGELIMGENVVVSYGARIITGTDQSDGKFMCDNQPESQRHVIRGKIILEDGVFVGANAIITVSRFHPVVIIGEGAVVGSGSYIDKSLDPECVVHPKQSLSILRRTYSSEE